MHTVGTPVHWIAFGVLIVVLLALDLGVFHRHPHKIGIREAAVWSAIWIGVGVLFNVVLYVAFGVERGLEFTTAYVIEKALSIDNIFVFLVVFSTFAVPAKQQHRVLFWGILGALVMRGLFIAAGTALLARFHVVTYIFGGILVVSGAKLFFSKSDHDVHPDKNIAVRLFRRLVPVTKDFHDHHFLVKEGGRWMATPLLVVLVALEASDIIFAVDSVPAVLAVSDDVFIVYTSNIFAILGLRSLYFVVAGALRRFHLLKYGLSLVLVFVGAKMIAGHWFKVPILISLAVIASLIGAAVVASLAWPAPAKAGEH